MTSEVNRDNTVAAAGTHLLGGDLPVTRMGFGTMRLPAWPAGAQPSREQAIAVLRRAVELGVTHLDTAAFYATRTDTGELSANELIHAALHPYPAGLVIGTKVGPVFGPDADIVGPMDTMRPGHRPDELRKAVEANLTQLGVDRLDLVNLRVGEMEPATKSLGAAFEALAALREEGLIRHLGVSNITPPLLAEAQAIAPVASVQNMFNIQHRQDDELVDRTAADGLGYVPFFPLGGDGLLDDPAIRAVAARHRASATQVALAWLLARSPTILLIPGTSSVDHLEQNIAAGNLAFTADDLAELDKVAPADTDRVE